MSPPRRLRISAGTRRGLRIQSPPTIRPTSGRLREALFDLWAERLAGCRFLDLFAGSGAVGIEAASRGAAHVVLVESDRGVLAILEHNLRRVALPGVAALRARLPDELERRLPAADRFDLIFADPPYRLCDHLALLAAAESRLAARGELALEHRWTGREPVSPTGLAAISSRKYGDSGLTIYRRLA